MVAETFTFDRNLARQLPLTPHAIDRCIERRIRAEHVNFVFFHGDLSFPTHAGRRTCEMSHRAAMQLRRQGVGPMNIGLLTSLTLIVSKSDSIVTAYRN